MWFRTQHAVTLVTSTQTQTILTPTIFNNQPFLAYISHFLNNFNENYLILLIVDCW